MVLISLRATVILQEADNDPTGEAAANTQQTLTFYELDLGLNHVVRKYSEPLEEHGNFLITGTFLLELLCTILLSPFYVQTQHCLLNMIWKL